MVDAAVDRLLAAARARIGRRVAAHELDDEIRGGSLVIDTRSAAQRDRDGELPGAVVVERNVLEWRLDPSSSHRLVQLDRPDRRVVIVCDEGYASSLAAATLVDLGLAYATDLEGGVQAWLEHTNVEDSKVEHTVRGDRPPSRSRRAIWPETAGRDCPDRAATWSTIAIPR